MAMTAWCGEIRDQLDLLVGERPHRAPHHHNDADWTPFSQEGNSKHGAVPSQFRSFGRKVVIGFNENVGNLDRSASKHDPTDSRPAIRGYPISFHELLKFRRGAALGRPIILCAVRAGDRCHVGLAKPRRELGQRFEYDLQVESRATDNLEHVGGGGLLLQRFPQFVEQAGVFDRDDGLFGEAFDKLDLPVGERPDLLTIDDNAPDQRLVLEHGHCEVRPSAPQPRRGRWPSCIVGGVDYVSGLP